MNSVFPGSMQNSDLSFSFDTAYSNAMCNRIFRRLRIWCKCKKFRFSGFMMALISVIVVFSLGPLHFFFRGVLF